MQRGNMNEEKEISESETCEMFSNLKTTEENERGKGNMDAIPGGDINKGEEKIMTPAEMRGICNNMKTREDRHKFYRSPFYVEWEKKSATQRVEAYAKIALVHYNGQNGTNYELHEVVKSCSSGGGPALYFHMNFVAKSSVSETFVMFFAELARERSKLRVRICCLLDPVSGMQSGCKICGKDMHHPTNVVMGMNKEKEITEYKISEMMANHEDDITAHHIYANVESEFCYLPYPCDDIEVDDNDSRRILPPVTKLEKTGHAIAHAVLCATEARFHKGRKGRNTPKSIWRFSVKSLIQTMATRTNQEGDWSIESIDKAISTCGIGLACDEDHPRQLGPKVDGVHLRSVKFDEANSYDEMFAEIHKKGPIIALIQPDDHFADWIPEIAKERVYSGFSSLSKHAVALIGTSSFDDDRKYFIAQNCYGKEWGDMGVFRIMADDIVEFIVPVLGGY